MNVGVWHPLAQHSQEPAYHPQSPPAFHPQTTIPNQLISFCSYTTWRNHRSRSMPGSDQRRKGGNKKKRRQRKQEELRVQWQREEYEVRRQQEADCYSAFLQILAPPSPIQQATTGSPSALPPTPAAPTSPPEGVATQWVLPPQKAITQNHPSFAQMQLFKFFGNGDIDGTIIQSWWTCPCYPERNN